MFKKIKGHQKHKMWGRRAGKGRFFFFFLFFFSFFRMCFNVYDYQSKASRYKKQLTYLKNKTISNQMHTTD